MKPSWRGAWWRWARAWLVGLLLAGACRNAAPPGRGDEAHEQGEGREETDGGAPVEAVHVEPRQAESWGLLVGPPLVTDIRAELVLPGVLGTDDNRTARVASLVPGQLAALESDLGSRVRVGQVLALLNSPEFARSQTAYLQARAQVLLSRRDYERARALWESQALEEREFLRRQAQFQEHLALLAAAEGVLRALGLSPADLAQLDALLLDEDPGGSTPSGVTPLLPLRSPLGGVVLERAAVVGDPVEPGKVLFTVSDLSVLWAHLDAYEHQLPALGTDAELVIRTPLFPDREFPARITVVAQQVDPSLRTVRVRAEVPNPDGLLRPNLYVQGFLRQRAPGESRLVVPAEAVQLHGGRHVVFVEVPPEAGESHRVFQVRGVEVGEALSLGRVILGGVGRDEAVVLKGAFSLKAELAKGVGGHGHVH